MPDNEYSEPKPDNERAEGESPSRTGGYAEGSHLGPQHQSGEHKSRESRYTDSGGASPAPRSGKRRSSSYD